MPKPGEIRYCPELGGQETNAAFVWIPPGSFWMGDKREENNPVRFVTLTKGFWLQQTPLTERQYRHINSDFPKGELSWYDVIQFCRNKPLRMPTEAEWEYAARGNTGHKYLCAGSNVADNVAWTKDNANNKSHEVGQLKSNSHRLFDMSGNVSEWCSDRYKKKLSTIPQVNPIGPMTGERLVHRGGSWNSEWRRAQVVNRSSDGPYSDDVRGAALGVRLVWRSQHD